MLPIKITSLKQNNLKNINLEIPKNKITVFTGVSGSGKSSTSYRGSEDFELKVHNLIKILKCKPDFLIINGLQVYQVYFFPDCHWIFQTDTRKVNLFF